MEKGKQLLGYLTMYSRDNYFRGAALVTDDRGIPMDFRYTEPVRPTRLERILYGGALDIYLREDILLSNLINAVDTTPQLWLVEDEELIRPIQRVSKLPALALETSQRPPLEQSGQVEPTAEQGVFIFQADNISAPLRLIVSDENIAKIQQLTQILTSAAVEMELLEPFSRIEKAFDAIAEAESKQ